MYYSETEIAIPKYPLVPDETGNRMFKAAKAKCAVNHIRADFLIPHRKDYYFFVLVRQGCSRHWIDMKPYQLKPDTFLFTKPSQVHLKEEAQPFTGTNISVTEEFFALGEHAFFKQLPIIQNIHNGHEIILSVNDLRFVDDMMNKIYDESHAKNNWQQSMLLSYMQTLLIYVSRLYLEQFSHSESVPGKLLLKKYLASIEDFYTELHQVSDYAGMLNLSAGHLSELVKEQSGKPAIAHIHERLILEAKRLLFHKDQSIKEIAFQLGFEDASYFNRFFKRNTTATPLEYRKSVREMYH